jgi:molybdopterin-binding protein
MKERDTSVIRVKKVTAKQLEALSKLYNKPVTEVINVITNDAYLKNLSLLVGSDAQALIQVINHV